MAVKQDYVDYFGDISTFLEHEATRDAGKLFAMACSNNLAVNLEVGCYLDILENGSADKKRLVLLIALRDVHEVLLEQNWEENANAYWEQPIYKLIRLTEVAFTTDFLGADARRQLIDFFSEFEPEMA